MSGSVGGSITDFFKSYALTGNQYVDGLILASLIPLVVAYINGFFAIITRFGSYILSWIASYITETIKARFVGKVLCYISITEENRIFNVIKELVFRTDVQSDVSSYIMTRLANIKDDNDKDSDFKMFSRWSEYDKFDVTIDQSGEKLFRMSKNYSSIDIAMKAFQYKEYFVKFTLKYDSVKDQNDKNNSKSGNKMSIELITMKSITKSKNEYEYANIIEDFLKTKFKVNEYITYHYAIHTRNPYLCRLITNFMSKGSMSATNLLEYGDLKFELLKENVKPKFLPNKLSVNLTVQNVDTSNTVESISKDVNLTSNYAETAVLGRGSLQSIYEQFIGKLKSPGITNYAYYIDDNKIIFLLFEGNNSVTIDIVSAGKILNDNDIKSVISFMIKNSNAVAKTTESAKKLINVYKYESDNGWMKYPLDRRTFNSIFIKHETLLQIKKEVENFMRVEKLYRDCDFPYRKGILFYGPPGTGKTSLAKAIAYEYQLEMYIINVNDKDVNDDSIIYMLNSIGGSGNKILLFEDIDSAFTDKEKVKFEEKLEYTTSVVSQKEGAVPMTNNSSRKYLTYAGLLNALDGVLSSQHGVITIMTTNYIDKLGDALIRPGRIDHRYVLGTCDYEQICKMTKFIVAKSLELINTNQLETLSVDAKKYSDEYLNEHIEIFAKKLIDDKKESTVKPCQLQQYVLKYIENPDEIFGHYEELLKN